MNLPKQLAALRYRDFRLYWSGQAVSLAGTWMQMMASGWVVTRLSNDAIVLGLITAASSVPMLLLSLKAGQLADRYEKRRILIITQIVLMGLAFAYAALVHTKHVNLPIWFVLAGISGVVAAFDMPAAQAMPPELVEPKDIANAVALMQAIFHAARLVGPALAGLLIEAWGEEAAFAANGLSFLAVIGTLLAISKRPPKPKKAGANARGGSISEGLAYVKGEPATRALILLTTLVTGLIFPFLAVLMVYYVRYTLESSAGVLGILMSCSGFGSLAGAMAILSGTAETRRHWLVFGVTGAAIGMIGLSLASTLPFLIPSSLLLAFSVSSLMGRAAQMVQERVPPELRGRVMGVYTMSFIGVMPFSSLFWSWLVDRLGRGPGHRRAMQIAAALFFTGGLFVLRSAWGALAERKAAPLSPAPEAPGAAA